MSYILLYLHFVGRYYPQRKIRTIKSSRSEKNVGNAFKFQQSINQQLWPQSHSDPMEQGSRRPAGCWTAPSS